MPPTERDIRAEVVQSLAFMRESLSSLRSDSPTFYDSVISRIEETERNIIDSTLEKIR